jgi:hypothetical protein
MLHFERRTSETYVNTGSKDYCFSHRSFIEDGRNRSSRKNNITSNFLLCFAWEEATNLIIAGNSNSLKEQHENYDVLKWPSKNENTFHWSSYRY